MSCTYRKHQVDGCLVTGRQRAVNGTIAPPCKRLTQFTMHFPQQTPSPRSPKMFVPKLISMQGFAHETFYINSNLH